MISNFGDGPPYEAFEVLRNNAPVLSILSSRRQGGKQALILVHTKHRDVQFFQGPGNFFWLGGFTGAGLVALFEEARPT